MTGVIKLHWSYLKETKLVWGLVRTHDQSFDIANVDIAASNGDTCIQSRQGQKVRRLEGSGIRLRAFLVLNTYTHLDRSLFECRSAPVKQTPLVSLVRTPRCDARRAGAWLGNAGHLLRTNLGDPNNGLVHGDLTYKE